MNSPGLSSFTLEVMYPELPDYLRPNLKVVFIGFNAGERSAQVGHYYAYHGNQFWNFLHEAGFVPEKLRPEEDCRVLEFGIGLTDIVKRWSKSASNLTSLDYGEGAPKLLAKLEQVRAQVVAFNGKGIYERIARRPVHLGWQPERLFGSRIFVLPSTSGRSGRLTREAKLKYFRQLARWVKRHG